MKKIPILKTNPQWIEAVKGSEKTKKKKFSWYFMMLKNISKMKKDPNNWMRP